MKVLSNMFEIDLIVLSVWPSDTAHFFSFSFHVNHCHRMRSPSLKIWLLRPLPVKLFWSNQKCSVIREVKSSSLVFLCLQEAQKRKIEVMQLICFWEMAPSRQSKGNSVCLQSKLITIDVPRVWLAAGYPVTSVSGSGYCLIRYLRVVFLRWDIREFY